jgi:NADP-dependent 3-hydroxy acid dehydrogenase YdfG
VEIRWRLLVDSDGSGWNTGTMTESPTDGTRVWLITGANSGFGRAIAEAALAAGDTVVAAARRPDTLADLTAVAPDRVTPLRLGITDHDRIARRRRRGASE